jgi:hypothetical protein
VSEQPRAALAPSPERGHVRLHPGFIDKHEVARVDLALMAFPPLTLPRQFRPVLLGRQNGFF